MMNLAQAFRLRSDTRLALVGAGGKTVALFTLARQLAPALVTTSTHLGTTQTQAADRHLVWPVGEALPLRHADLRQGVTLVSGGVDTLSSRLQSPSVAQLEELAALAGAAHVPLLIEADGARMRPLKAPAAHEPAIPSFADTVIVVAGLSAIGRPLSAEWVHRAEIFAALAALPGGANITVEAVARLLRHPCGGLKNIPPAARRLVLLNQADDAEHRAMGQRLAEMLLGSFDAVGVAALQAESAPPLIFEPIGGVVLAAGASRRFGGPKQLLEWEGEPLVRRVARAALAGGVWPVVVVTGAEAERVAGALAGLDVRIVNNPAWQQGQSASIRTALESLPPETGAAIFLLADQPHTPPTLIRALVEQHRRTLAPIIAPLVRQQRANPVLFDRQTFADLLALRGDVGGRALFSRYAVSWLPWHDERVLMDVDTPADYAKLVGG